MGYLELQYYLESRGSKGRFLVKVVSEIGQGRA